MPRGQARPYPPVSVINAAKIAQGIRDHNGGNPMNRILLAAGLKRGPSSSDFREEIGACSKYGYINGNYNSDFLELTPLGQQLTMPRDESERLDALRQGIRSIPLFEQLLVYFDNNKLPSPDFLKNTLEREPFNVPGQLSQGAAEIFIENGKSVGFVRDIQGSPYVILDAGPPAIEAPVDEIVIDPSATDIGAANVAQPTDLHEQIEPIAVPKHPASTSTQSTTTLQFFVAHGRDKDALTQVQSILDQLSIPYVVAVEEPNAGRPISQKVKDLMDSCSGGIFIFSADEELKDNQGNSVFRPRENVIYELGAASYVFGQSIVIFKEKAVSLPSDFRDLGYIEYDKGKLMEKTMDLLKELIALKAVKLLPGG